MMIGKGSEIQQSVMDDVDDNLSIGNTEGVKEQLKRTALNMAGEEQRRRMMGKERTVELLDEIKDDLANFQKSGGDTNIFSGTAEQAAKKVGTVINPEARRIATKIAAAIQSYRLAMTGLQFGLPENKEYKDMFPSINRTINLNYATLIS